jgi:hypothetical protein
MPVAAIPFKSPAPFDLPPYIAEALRELSLPAAIEQVAQMLMDSGCADVILSAVVDGAGCVRPGPYRAQDPRHADAAQAIHTEMATEPLALDSDAGRANFLVQAINGGQPLLMMGDVTPEGNDPFPAAFRAYLLQGQAQANVGFLYVFPLKDDDGNVHGALALHRALGSGPLNHDQPAITHALVLELSRRAGQLAKQA